ncbi:MAG TPA: non-heme iron oxygenase ferredoxin subunit [Mycobacteriales bacterium]|nr:non-heme iron oxygenase ferredoxin subunit [Mycobacteriales bacterium]
MSFVRACALSDLADDTALAVEVEGVPLCVARSQGEVMALLDECSHAEVALSDGEVGNGTVECWLHGSRFDLRTGKPIGPPATEAVTTYQVRVDGDDVLVDVKE